MGVAAIVPSTMIVVDAIKKSHQKLINENKNSKIVKNINKKN